MSENQISLIDMNRPRRGKQPPIVSDKQRKGTAIPDINLEHIESRSFSITESADYLGGGLLMKTMLKYLPHRTKYITSSGFREQHYDKPAKQYSFPRPSDLDIKETKFPPPTPSSSESLSPITMKEFNYPSEAKKPTQPRLNSMYRGPPKLNLFSGGGLSDGFKSDEPSSFGTHSEGSFDEPDDSNTARAKPLAVADMVPLNPPVRTLPIKPVPSKPAAPPPGLKLSISDLRNKPSVDKRLPIHERLRQKYAASKTKLQDADTERSDLNIKNSESGSGSKDEIPSQQDSTHGITIDAPNTEKPGEGNLPRKKSDDTSSESDQLSRSGSRNFAPSGGSIKYEDVKEGDQEPNKPPSKPPSGSPGRLPAAPSRAKEMKSRRPKYKDKWSDRDWEAIGRGFTDFMAKNALAIHRIPPKIPIPRYVDDHKGKSHLWCPSGLARFYIYKPDFGRVPAYIKKRMKEFGIQRKRATDSDTCSSSSDSSVVFPSEGNQHMNNTFRTDCCTQSTKSTATKRLDHDPYTWNHLFSRKGNKDEEQKQPETKKRKMRRKCVMRSTETNPVSVPGPSLVSEAETEVLKSEPPGVEVSVHDILKGKIPLRLIAKAQRAEAEAKVEDEVVVETGDEDEESEKSGEDEESEKSGEDEESEKTDEDEESGKSDESGSEDDEEVRKIQSVRQEQTDI